MPNIVPRKFGRIGEPHYISLALTCLVGGVFVGIVVLIAMKLRSWYRKDSDDAAERDQMLLQFHELKRQGGLSEDEYRSIRGRLVAPSASSPNGTESVASEGTALTDGGSAESDSQPQDPLADQADS